MSHISIPSSDDFPHREIPISKYIPFGSLGDPIHLYSGKIIFSQNENSFSVNTLIEFTWLPSPQVRFITDNPPIAEVRKLNGPEDISLQLDDGTKVERGIITARSISRNMQGELASLSGIIGERIIRSENSSIKYVKFLLPNFQDIIGKPISCGDGNSISRSILRHSGSWKITIDAVDHSKDVFDFIEKTSGFGVTHIGKIEKEDGDFFTSDDAISILEALHWYCSFAIGRWTGPCLPFGFDQDGETVWQMWDFFRISPFHKNSSWLGWGSRRHIFEEPFQGFFALWTDDDWNEIIELSIHWYIDANSRQGSIEGAIVLTQVALELLASVILVESYGWLSQDGYRKLSAFDTIRILLIWADIPIYIPSELQELHGLSKEKNWQDSAKAMTEVRNKITHPQKKNRKDFLQLSRKLKIDTWKLSLWNLELLLLKLFKYEGKYANRISRQNIGDVELVPWAKDAND